MCDTGSSVSILPKVMADHLGLKIEPSQDSFTFLDHSTRNSRGIIRDLEVQIENTLVPVDFHVLENKKNNSTAWERFHGHCKSSLQHADKSVVSDTDKSWCPL